MKQIECVRETVRWFKRDGRVTIPVQFCRKYKLSNASVLGVEVTEDGDLMIHTKAGKGEVFIRVLTENTILIPIGIRRTCKISHETKVDFIEMTDGFLIKILNKKEAK